MYSMSILTSIGGSVGAFLLILLTAWLTRRWWKASRFPGLRLVMIGLYLLLIVAGLDALRQLGVLAYLNPVAGPAGVPRGMTASSSWLMNLMAAPWLTWTQIGLRVLGKVLLIVGFLRLSKDRVLGRDSV